ncbi:hypothetical protein QNM99_16910 [Pseudomonas sp. PCH446]
MKEDLIAPRVEQAAPEDGLLPASELDTPITVSLPLWPNARPDDFYQLTWDNALIGEPMKLAPPLNLAICCMRKSRSPRSPPKGPISSVIG